MKKNRHQLTIAEIGEWGLLDRLAQFYPPVKAPFRMVFPEDVAMVDLSPHLPYYLVLTCDMLMEGTHFQLDGWDFYSLGRKSVAAGLSDMAAKGAAPKFVLISLGLPPKIQVKQVEQLYKGIRDQAEQFGCYLVGGDTIGATYLTIDVCLVGEKDKQTLLPGRNCARVGQNVFVTGQLGDSGAGCWLLKYQKSKVKNQKYYCRALINRHKRPEPRVKEGQLLSKNLADLAMIDISDGLYNELQLLARFSGVGFTIKADALPRSRPLTQFCRARRLNPLQFVLFGGEDFELLFTTTATENKIYRIWQRNKVKTPVSIIGMVTAEKEIIMLDSKAKPIRITDKTYRHF